MIQQREHGRRDGSEIWDFHGDRPRLLSLLSHALQPGYEESPGGSEEEWGRGDYIAQKGKIKPLFRLGQSTTKTTTTTTGTAWQARVFFLSWNKGIESRFVSFYTFSFLTFSFHQVYVYTFTGLHDKGANHLTQFLGFMLRPKAPTFQALEDEPTGR